MLTTVARSVLVMLLGLALQGCLYEANLDSAGKGTMTVTIALPTRQDLDNVKGDMQSSAVRVTSADFVEDAERNRGIIKLAFDDVTQLSTTRFFHDVAVTRSEGINGTKVLTAVAKHNPVSELPEAVLKRFGPEIKVVVTFAAQVVEANGTVSGGNTVTWTWGVKDYFKQPEIIMTVAYKATPATAGPATAAPVPATPAGTPAAGGQR